LYVLLGSFLFAMAFQSIQDGGRSLGKGIVIIIVGFILWRFFIFLRALFRPAVEKINSNKAANKFVDHVNQSLDEALGKDIKK